MTPKQLIEDETTLAIPLFQAVEKEIGEFLTWEPDSLWIELESKKIKIPSINQNKLLAVVALKLTPAFYWDYRVYEMTAATFNNVEPNNQTLLEVHPEYLTWAVIEASMLRGSESINFDSEPKKYTAVVLHRAGFLVAPEELSFCQEDLDLLNHNKEEKEKVLEAWKASPRNILSTKEYKEEKIDIQLAKLATVYLYVEAQRKLLNEQLSQLKSK